MRLVGNFFASWIFTFAVGFYLGAMDAGLPVWLAVFAGQCILKTCESDLRVRDRQAWLAERALWHYRPGWPE